MKVIKPAAALSAGAFSRASTATYVDAAGVIQTAGVNVPRYQAGALMVESGAINLLTYSQDFDNGAWVPAAVSVTPNDATAPDGTITGEKLLESAATSNHILQRVMTPAVQAYTLSVYAKEGERSVLWLGLGFTGGGRFGFDLAAGVVLNGTISESAATIQSIGAGWYRCSITVAATTTASGQVQIGLKDDTVVSGSVSYAGDGTSGLYVWGAQLETGAVASSYIPTAASAMGRLSDIYTPGVISSVPETDHAAWVAATAYTVGNRVIRTSTHRIYERVVAGTTATAPELDAINWTDIGPTNAWAILDGEVSTATTAAADIKITVAPGRATGLALFGLVGSSVSVSVVDGDTGALVYQASTQLDAAVIQDWWAYVYEPFRQQAEWVLSDLPPYSNARISIVISGAVTACSALVVGTVYGLGGTLSGPRLGIADYSRKETDEFGVATFVRRAYAKRLTCELLLTTGELAGVLAILSDLRATPAVYIAAETTELNPLLIYGWYRDFGITVAYVTRCLCSLDLEGLT